MKTVGQTALMAGLISGIMGLATMTGVSAFGADTPPSFYYAAHHQQAQQAEPAELSDAERLSDLLATLDTFSADVRQLIVESTGGVLEESQIRFMLRRPHGFYWETLEPFPETIVTDGQSLWNYQPDLLQLTIEDWNAERTELAAQLLSGQTQTLADEYDISAMPTDRNGWEFVLTPLNPASLYQRVMLYFEETQLVSILLVSTNGQRTFWEFHNRQINECLDAALFVFEIPDDDMLDILDNRQAAQGSL